MTKSGGQLLHHARLCDVSALTVRVEMSVYLLTYLLICMGYTLPTLDQYIAECWLRFRRHGGTLCTSLMRSDSAETRTTTTSPPGGRPRRQRRVNCVMSSWSSWSSCPTSCDAGVTWTTRERRVIRQPEHGGRACPRRLRRRRRCRPPAHCRTYTVDQCYLLSLRVESFWTSPLVTEKLWQYRLID